MDEFASGTRYYDPYSQRFLSEDPIGFRGGDYNLYRYMLNMPTLGRDPSGKHWIDDIIKIGICKINPNCCEGSISDRIRCSVTDPGPEPEPEPDPTPEPGPAPEPDPDPKPIVPPLACWELG